MSSLAPRFINTGAGSTKEDDMKRLILAAALALCATPALAQETHGDNAEVQSAPADDAVLAAAPSALSLTFEHAVVLTQVQLHGPDTPPFR
jgi:methionine-rich copper-binding protein CopC